MIKKNISLKNYNSFNIEVNAKEFVEVNSKDQLIEIANITKGCLLYTSPSPRDLSTSRMPSSA